MILRRVIAHVKAQNWLAVAIDFVIVVLGVFIGIQVSNWNADRQNAQLSQNYLERLENDVELELALWEKAGDYFGTARRHGLAALDDYLKSADALDQRFLISLYQASQVWFVRPTRATFDELQTTGRIVLIRDENLRTALVNHYGRLDATLFTFSQTSQYRRIARLNMDQRVQQRIRDDCGDEWIVDERNFYFVRLPTDCGAEFPEALARDEIARLRASDEVQRELRFHLSVLDAQIGTLGNTVATARTTLEMIRKARR